MFMFKMLKGNTSEIFFERSLRQQYMCNMYDNLR